MCKFNYFNYCKILKSGWKGKYCVKGVKVRVWGKSKIYDGIFIGKGRGLGKYLVFVCKGSS